MSRFLFPRWSNAFLPLVIILGAIAPLYVGLFVAYGFSPKTLEAGYMPTQPVPYSHAIHAGKLGMDCRYCHTSVENASFAAVPATQTCMNCHTQIHRESPKLEKVRSSYETGMPIEWIKVHKLADYTYFNHSAHVVRGVGCVECHGRIDQMEVVYRVAPLSMGWCLECHRNPTDRIRPPSMVTQMAWDQNKEMTQAQRVELQNLNNIHPNSNCSTCHR